MGTYRTVTDPAVVSLLTDGAVGVLPTDTVYGIVARAADRTAVARLYRIKHREGKPGTLIAANIEQLTELGIDATSLERVAPLWSAPISIVLPVDSHLTYIDQGKASLAVRIPQLPDLQRLLEQTGPLLTSSANLPGEPPASTVPEAQDYFGDAVDFYVDGCDMSVSISSTVALLTAEGALSILRQGAVIIEQGVR